MAQRSAAGVARRRIANRERMRRWRAVHPDEARAYAVAWESAHRARRAIQAVARYHSSPEKHRAAARRTKERHPEVAAAAVRRWRAANPERLRQLGNERRAREAGAVGSHTVQEWVEKCALLGDVCIYCGESKPLTRDHKIPLSRGGSNAIENMAPACRSCNSSKKHRTAGEFLEYRRRNAASQ